MKNCIYKRALLGSAALTLVAASLTMPAFAQSASVQGDDAEELTQEAVVVTGTRQAYRGDFDTLEVPQVDQILGPQILADVNAFDLADALDLSASVARQNNFGGLWNAFAIRGFPGDINLPSGFLVNGFNAGRGFSGPRDIAGIESVEVLKGPRSALFGRGEPGGTVNLVTKRPTFTNGGYVRGTIGSWEQYRAEADVQSFVDTGAGDLGFRIVGVYEDAESFREGLETELFGLYPSITYATPGGTTFTYELEYTTQEIPQDRGVVFSPVFGFSPIEVFTGENVPIETEVLGHQFEVNHKFNDNWSLLAGIGYRETSLEGGAFENQFGDPTIGFGRQTFFIDGQTISRFFRDRDFESDYFVVRGELSGEFNTGPFRHRVIVGADYDEFDNTQVIDRFRPTFTGDPALATPEDFANFLLLDVNDPVFGLNLDPLAGPNTNREELFEAVGVYIQDQIDITDRLQVRVGVRFDDFDQEFANLLSDPVSEATLSDTRFSPQAGVVYQATDSISIYASYGEGFRQQTGVDFQGNLLDPNITESFEGGFKAELGGFSPAIDGLLTVAAFRVDQNNVLVNDTRPLEPTNTIGFAVQPAGDARSRGIEVDASLTILDDWSFWLSYAYTDAEFLTGGADDSGFGNIIEPGDPLINVPEHQLSVQVAKDFEVWNIPFRTGGGLLYVDDRNGFVGTDFELPDYTTVRLFTEVEPFPNISMRLDIDNLFDETFFTNSFADVWVQPGAPRQFRFSVAYNF